MAAMPDARWTHDPFKLARACLILFACLIGTALLGKWSGYYDMPSWEEDEFAGRIENGEWDQAFQILKEFLSDDAFTPEDQIAFVHSAAKAWGKHEAGPVLAYLRQHPLSEILVPLWEAAATPPENPEDPQLSLRLASEHLPPPPHAHFALGYWLFQNERWVPAAEAFAREAALQDDSRSREWEISCYYQALDFNSLEKLAAQEAYRPLFYSSLLREMALQRQDWAAFARWLVPAEYEDVQSWALAMAAFTACVWLAICIQIAWSPPWKWQDGLAYAAAFALGVMSTWVTVFWGNWSDRVLELKEPTDSFGTVLFCLIGIGLPEEAFKLACFLPLLPWVLKVNRPLAALMIPAFTGLGFACEENITYLEDSDSLTAVARFVEANFLHLSTTGIAGYNLVRACQNRNSGWDGFFYAFAGVVLAHGLYDAFLMASDLEPFWFVPSGCLVLLAHYFFADVAVTRGRIRHPFSLTATFALGLTLLSGASFHFLMPLEDPWPAFHALGLSLLSSGPLIYMFVRETHEL